MENLWKLKVSKALKVLIIISPCGKSLGITHVVNAAEGDWVASVNVDREAFKENGEDEEVEPIYQINYLGIEYFGLLCNDMDNVDISVFFKVSFACVSLCTFLLLPGHCWNLIFYFLSAWKGNFF